MPYERLKQFALNKCPDNGGDHVYQLELLPFHVVREQMPRIESEPEESGIEKICELFDGPGHMASNDLRARSICSGLIIKD